MSYNQNLVQQILTSPEVVRLREEIIWHQFFRAMNSQKHLRVFMEYHVFQVWDFMILLKSIQFWINSIYTQWWENFSCWFPKVPWKFSRLINEICLDEESDTELSDFSHFEFYLKAMEQSGADMYFIEKSLSYVREIKNIDQNLEWFNFFPCASVKEHFFFMREVSNIISDPDHLLYKPLASFCIGREGLIPDFFTSIIREISAHSKINNNYFIQYLERHIELDWDEHSEKWYELLGYFLEDENIDEALSIVIKSLELRKKVLDSMLENIITH